MQHSERKGLGEVSVQDHGTGGMEEALVQGRGGKEQLSGLAMTQEVRCRNEQAQ